MQLLSPVLGTLLLFLAGTQLVCWHFPPMVTPCRSTDQNHTIWQSADLFYTAVTLAQKGDRRGPAEMVP